MPEVAGAVIGAIAVICIPFVAWLSRRSTREGRLLIRVERLGSVYALMPSSPAKEVFEGYLSAAVRDLNAWLDPGNAKRRRIIQRISGWTYTIGMLVFLLAQPSVQSDAHPSHSLWAGVAIGSGIVGVTLASSYLLERQSRRENAEAKKAREAAAAAVRMESLRRGEPINFPLGGA